ncbi:MAG: DUF4221 family protein [Mongoliitalea sp.]
MKVFKLVFIALIAVACSKGAQDAVEPIGDGGSDKILNYELSEAFSLALEETSTFTTSLQVIEEDGQELLVFADFKNRDRIFLFDISTGDMIDRIKFELDGPNGIGSMNGFYYLNRDSIFIVNSFLYKVFQVNSKGDIIRRYDLKNSDGSVSILPHPTHQPLTGAIGEELFIKGIGEKNPYQKDYYNDMVVTQRLNLENGNVRDGIRFPEKYRDNFFHLSNSIVIYQTIFNKEIYQSFPSEENIYVYDRDFNGVNTIKANHTNVTPIGPVKESQVNSDDGYFILYSKGQYGQVLIDPINHFLFREVTVPPVSLDQYSNYKELRDSSRQGLVIYDLKKNQKVGEIIFSMDEVELSSMFFVGKKGLYISKEDPVENMVRFYLLSFES